MRPAFRNTDSKPGAAPDTNGDGLADERTYTGPTAAAAVRTPAGSVQKTVEADELTYGSTLVCILVPAQPINATLYNVVVTDTLDSNLQLVGVENGTANGDRGRRPSPPFPRQQQVVVVTAALPANSPAAPGTLVRNTGLRELYQRRRQAEQRDRQHARCAGADNQQDGGAGGGVQPGTGGLHDYRAQCGQRPGRGGAGGGHFARRVRLFDSSSN